MSEKLLVLVFLFSSASVYLVTYVAYLFFVFWLLRRQRIAAGGGIMDASVPQMVARKLCSRIWHVGIVPHTRGAVTFWGCPCDYQWSRNFLTVIRPGVPCFNDTTGEWLARRGWK